MARSYKRDAIGRFAGSLAGRGAGALSGRTSRSTKRTLKTISKMGMTPVQLKVLPHTQANPRFSRR